MSNPTNDSASRWAAAERLAEGITDDGYHRRRARILLQVVALIVASWIVGVVIALLLLPKSGTSHHIQGGPTDQQVIAQSVFVGLGFVVGVAGFIWGKRTGHYITRWRAVASPLSRAEKKNVRRQISCKAELDREHLNVIVAIARQNRRATLGIAPIYAAVVLFAIGTAVGSDVLAVKLLELAVSLLFVGVAVQLVVLFRRTGRFIDRHTGAAWTDSSHQEFSG